LRARFGCPVTLVIVALDPEVASWCAEPIDLGRQRGTIHPLVLGPAQIPIIVDPCATSTMDGRCFTLTSSLPCSARSHAPPWS
jgi:hypothetical protein